MEHINKARGQYFKLIESRRAVSRISRPHQDTGVYLASILDDKRHTSLYIKLAKMYRPEWLLALAKSVAERRGVANRGAYFMKLLKQETTPRHDAG